MFAIFEIAQTWDEAFPVSPFCARLLNIRAVVLAAGLPPRSQLHKDNLDTILRFSCSWLANHYRRRPECVCRVRVLIVQRLLAQAAFNTENALPSSWPNQASVERRKWWMRRGSGSRVTDRQNKSSLK